ncbi:hypothetical protein QBC42DRAFT_278390 [Cladorrhinum samala]|uniref:Transmembrane protein n=1 Tax=Cladorrhinum samala TaxID=585594 RepID=A0AAV9HCC5_9PEZI|nr:hypothetical protein QBC42DRAFT_278390 [Cladorrhinum samala]
MIKSPRGVSPYNAAEPPRQILLVGMYVCVYVCVHVYVPWQRFLHFPGSHSLPSLITHSPKITLFLFPSFLFPLSSFRFLFLLPLALPQLPSHVDTYLLAKKCM